MSNFDTAVSSVEIDTIYSWGNTGSRTWDDVDRTWDTTWNVAVWSLAVEEGLTLDDCEVNDPAVAIDENISLQDVVRNCADLALSEALALSDNIGLVSIFKRTYEESLSISEFVSNTYGLNKNEAFRISDAWRRQADMVICDMILSSVSTPYTVEDFKDFMSYGNPAGFERWRDFVPGDYEYKDALFRIIMESKTADRGMLSGLQASIDVPDTYDHGSVSVSSANAGAAVVFNREFHIIPEITLSVRSGAGSNPVVVEFYGSPTLTGFTARLRDTVTGSYVTGSFSWAAHGY